MTRTGILTRGAGALPASLLLAALAAACAESSSWDDPQVSAEGGSHGTGASEGGVTASGDGSAGGADTGAAPPDAAPGATSDGGLTVTDGGVSLGDAAMPTNCTLGAAGAIALIPLETMAPGTACSTCHLAIGKPIAIAGTVYPTYHEPDLCLGVPNVQVEIDDASGAKHLLPTDSSGNFLQQVAVWPSPWKVAVVKGAARRDMVGTVTDGNCNNCHTAAGASSAPGRILVPDADGG